MKKRAFSIRYKFLLLLTSLPLVTLTVYLLLAMNIFEEDKIAYVFESSSRVSGTLAAQIKTQMNSVLSTAKPVIQDYLLNRKFTNLGESVFQNEYSLEAITVFNKDSENKFIVSAILEKSIGSTKEQFAKLGPKYSQYINGMENQSRAVYVPFGDDRVYILEKVTDEVSKRSTLFVLITKMSELGEMFKASQAQKMYLISSEGEIFFGPQGMTATAAKLQDILNPQFLRSENQQVGQGAETAKAADGSDLLVSFSSVGFGDLMVVSTVEKAKALGAMQVLLRKSLMFFGLLISATVLISLFASSGLTQALTQLFTATQKVAEGDFNIRVNIKSNDEVGSLAENFNLMAAEVSRLLVQTAEKARMESELQTAKTVQETLFPETNAQIGPLSISGFYEPASECGGDWWHYCLVGDKIFLWIGDATGHGAPAALITSAAKSASTIIERLSISPGKALELLNRSIYDVSKGRIMMTFFLASFDLKTGDLVYSNASHEAPFLLRSAHKDNLKKKDLVALNEVNNPRLGQSRDTTYSETSIKLEPDDMVFFYTDGIPDIRDPADTAWGEREFIKALISSNKDFPSPQESVERFARLFQGFRKSAMLVDDVTFFVMKNNLGA